MFAEIHIRYPRYRTGTAVRVYAKQRFSNTFVHKKLWANTFNERTFLSLRGTTFKKTFKIRSQNPFVSLKNAQPRAEITVCLVNYSQVYRYKIFIYSEGQIVSLLVWLFTLYMHTVIEYAAGPLNHTAITPRPYSVKHTGTAQITLVCEEY